MLFSEDTDIKRLISVSRELGVFEGILQLLSWDQETYMPKNASESRALQMSMLSGVAHTKLVNPENGELLKKLETNNNLNEYDRALVREFKRSYEKAIKLPVSFVEEITAHTSKCVEIWRHAKDNANFDLLTDSLNELVNLKFREAEYYGYTDTPYNALLDEYEPGLTVAHIEKLFEPLKVFTVDFLKRIVAAEIRVDESILHRGYDLQKQANISYEIAKALGFDFNAGRLDKSTHPFTSEFGTSKDVRITTRYTWDYVSPAIMATIHESGHAMYEQGINPEFDMTALGGGVSLGIHESQSRLWENFVGRSPEFWKHWFPIMVQRFGVVLSDSEQSQFVLALNKVKPSLIRVEADEITYNLHIIIRYEIEKALFNKEIQVKDLRDAWNAKYKEYLGVVPKDDSEGVLQDIHWASGSFGYFPTYTLGNLYSAQFWNSVSKDLPSIHEQLSVGAYDPLLLWLREHIHKYGKFYSAEELCIKTTGEPLNPKYLIDYLRTKFLNLYSI